MAIPTHAIRSTTPMTEAARTQMNRTAEEIRQEWTPAERQRRREQALAAQRRLFCLAFDLAA